MIIIFLVLFAFVNVQSSSNSTRNQTTQATLPSKVQQILDKMSIQSDRLELQRFYRTVLTEADEAKAENRESRSKMLYVGFICAMSHFKVSCENTYLTFRLNTIKKPPVIEWPENMYNLIKDSDYCIHNGARLEYTERAINISYSRWFLMASGAKYYTYDQNDAKRLREKLIDYYQAYKNTNNTTNSPHFVNITEFYKYFAAIMTRTYKLGCLFVNNLFSIVQLWINKKDFVDLFHQTMPRWNFTEIDMDLVNIAWEVSEEITKECQKLRVGYRLRRRFQEYDVDAIIPISDDCPRAYEFDL